MGATESLANRGGDGLCGYDVSGDEGRSKVVVDENGELEDAETAESGASSVPNFSKSAPVVWACRGGGLGLLSGSSCKVLSFRDLIFRAIECSEKGRLE